MTAARVPGCPGLLSSWWDKITWQHATQGRKVYLRSEGQGTSHSREAKATGPKNAIDVCQAHSTLSSPMRPQSPPLSASPSGSVPPGLYTHVSLCSVPTLPQGPIARMRLSLQSTCQAACSLPCEHPPDNSNCHWRDDGRKLPGRERCLTNYSNPLAHQSENQSRKSPSYVLRRL